jgi:zinc protease
VRPLLPTLALVTVMGCAGLGGSAPSALSPEQAEAKAIGEHGVVEEPEDLREPPAPGLMQQPSFPQVHRDTLSNGLRVSYLRRDGFPLTHLMLSFGSGRAREGDQAGVARLTARLMKLGGAGQYPGLQLIEQFQALGARLQVNTSSDQTTFSLTVLDEHLARALSLLGMLVQAPRMAAADLTVLKQQEREQAIARARGDLVWGNHMVLYRELFETPTGVHPYAHFDATAEDIDRLTPPDCTTWRNDHLVPNNAELVVVGSSETKAMFGSARTAFESWKPGPARAPRSMNRPPGPKRLQVFLIDHQDSAISEILAGVLGAPRSSAAWPALTIATHLLGVGAGSRLFLELADAPAVVELRATSKPDHTALVVQSLVSQIERLGQTPPTQSEVTHAARALTSGFLNHPNPLDSLARMLAAQGRFELGEDYYTTFHQALFALDADTVHRVVQPYFDGELSVIVVSADASKLAAPLSALAPVVVLDPDKSFSIKRTLPYSPLG